MSRLQVKDQGHGGRNSEIHIYTMSAEPSVDLPLGIVTDPSLRITPIEGQGHSSRPQVKVKESERLLRGDMLHFVLAVLLNKKYRCCTFQGCGCVHVNSENLSIGKENNIDIKLTCNSNSYCAIRYMYVFVGQGEIHVNLLTIMLILT